VASVQWSGGHREPNQGTWGAVRGEAVGLPELLGDGGASPIGDHSLQIVRPS